ncbi:hypothetical protein EV426DRAFT_534985 [Tirmania nivea]|nr:hypothetical protein EV426DRAFT_534985 [Tirmania nivea]
MARQSWEDDGAVATSVPLLSLGSSRSSGDGNGIGGSWKGKQGQQHTLLSRTPSPYPGLVGGNGNTGHGDGEYRRRGGSGNGKFSPWFKRGKLGCWFWHTGRGWISLVTALVVWTVGSGILLVFQNQIILRFGVYKFGYPVTATLLELLVIQLFLLLTASLTRSFSRPLLSLGLAHLIAPPPTPMRGKKPSFWSTSLLEDFLPTGVFGLSPSLIRTTLPLAVIHSAKLILANLSFAYTLRPIWQLSRVATIPITVLCTYFWANQNPPLSVTTLSSTLTMTFAVIMVSIQPPWLFTWEGVAAGICSSFFAAAEPVVMVSTFKEILAYHSPSGNSAAISTTSAVDEINLITDPMFHGDIHSLPRSHYHLIHYTTFLSALLTLPWVFISGEAGSISRNCYILDIPWFWLMIMLGGLASYTTMIGFWMLVKTTSPLTGNLVVEGLQITVQTILLGKFKMQEWGWMGAMTGWGAGVWYLLGRRRECGVTLWGGEVGDEVLWDRERREEENEVEFFVN